MSLTFIAMLIYVIPALTAHQCWRPAVLARLPYFLTTGLALFGIGGIWAGYHGVPRRIFDLNYHVDVPLEHIDAPFVWGTLMGVVGAGSLLMVVTLSIYLYALIRMLVTAGREVGVPLENLKSVSWSGADVAREHAWVGPLSVCVLVLSMYFFTALSFEILEGVPITSMGGGH